MFGPDWQNVDMEVADNNGSQNVQMEDIADVGGNESDEYLENQLNVNDVVNYVNEVVENPVIGHNNDNLAGEFIQNQDLFQNQCHAADEACFATSHGGDVMDLQSGGRHQSNGSARVFTSTLNSLPKSGNFFSYDLSDLSLNFEISTGTCQMIDAQLREAAVNLDVFECQNQAPQQASDSLRGSLSPGSIAPNISNPENMIDIADRKLTKIFHTI